MLPNIAQSNGLQAVLFDLDGTLIDSLPDLLAALNQVLKENSRRALVGDEVRRMIGDGSRTLVERGFAATGNQPEEAEMELLGRRFLDIYEAHSSDRTRPFPGVIETLGRLKAIGLRLAVVTNKPQKATEILLRDLKLEGFFDSVAGGGRAALKPEPDLIHLALREIGAEAPRTAFVGDSVNDILAARNAKLAAVLAVSFGYTKTPPADLGADAVIERFADLEAELGRFFPTRA